MKNENKDFTAIELVIVVGGVGTLAVVIGGIYVLCHFIAKVW